VATTREKKAPKAAFTIDFTGESPSTKELFTPGTKIGTQLPSTKRTGAKTVAAARRGEWLLPDDMHFSSRQLLRLFLKPKFAVSQVAALFSSQQLRMRRTAAQMAENANGEIDETFWAQAAAERADGGGDMDMDAGAPIPFESQFFHDDGDGDVDDDAFVDDHLVAADEADDLWLSTQGEELRRPRPENVRYAKRAKRVDVKRLKDDIWTDLRGLVDVPPDDEMEPQVAATPTEEVKVFDSVIHSLRTTYPRDKMSEISTSFCFICLLHLANEEGLRIETARTDGTEGLDSGMRGMYTPSSDDEDAMRPPPAKRLDSGDRHDRIVGELQALKVFKDPNAGRAA
jgi:condensin complex subunit 2